MRSGLPSSRKVRRAEEALAEIDRRQDRARNRAAKTRHPVDLGRYKALEEAARLVARALQSER